ncbi:MAG: M48 family metalloprotease [Armatimonadetes bacterium]|jgi:Zn-dependent protease with chaperone function|nr:M48 family metalloprotease [Armatimonadota bacterium]
MWRQLAPTAVGGSPDPGFGVKGDGAGRERKWAVRCRLRRAVARWVWAALALALLSVASGAVARTYTEEEEKQLGAEAAAQIEKEYKVLDDPEQIKRLNAILTNLAPVSNRPDVTYTVKILDTPDVNALSLPGGQLYVTRGLLEDVESDHELAGVLAHEIAHNAHRHSLHQLDKSAKLDQQLMLALLLGLAATRDTGETSKLVLIGQMVKIGVLNGYGQEAELEADRSAVEYMVASKKYNPVGMLQFLDRLRRQEERGPQMELGIFRTHPPTRQRVEAVRGVLDAYGVPVTRLPGKSTPVATARAVTVNGQQIAEVVLQDRILYQPAASLDGKDPLQRAEEAARRVSALFAEFPQERLLRVQASGDSRVVTYRGSPLFTISSADAQFHNASVDDLAKATTKELKAVIWSDFLRHGT